MLANLHALLVGIEAEHRGGELTHHGDIGSLRNRQPGEAVGGVDEEPAQILALEVNGGADGGAKSGQSKTDYFPEFVRP